MPIHPPVRWLGDRSSPTPSRWWRRARRGNAVRAIAIFILAIALALTDQHIASVLDADSAAAATADSSSTTPQALTVNGLSAPMAVDASSTITFSWQPAILDRTGVASSVPDQRAYRIVVARSRTAAAQGNGDVWDSGLVTSRRTQNVSYAGPQLATATRYWFSVRVVAGTGARSQWATPETFGTALGSNWGTAQAIWSTDASDWLFARDDLNLQHRRIASATLSATASSTTPSRQYVYKISVNGTFVGAGPTRSTGSEVRYNSYDVTSLLRAGQKNTISALLHTSSDHRFLAELVVHYTNGTQQRFGTGHGWRVLSGADVFPSAGSVGTNYYSAPRENIDARRYPTGYEEPGYDDDSWNTARIMHSFSTSSLLPSTTANLIQDTDAPVTVTRLGTGHYLVDFGQTRVGGVSLSVTSSRSRAVDIRYGSVLDSSKKAVEYKTSAGNDYEDSWTLRSGKQTVSSWGIRVFRYVELSNVPQAITKANLRALALRYPITASEATFSSSNSNLNAVWQLSRNTIINNTLDLSVDSWERERTVYEADAYIEQLAQSALSSDTALSSYSFEYALDNPTWPTEWRLYDVLAVHDAWQSSGDVSEIRKNYSVLRSIPLTKSISTTTGLVDHNDIQDLIDWPLSERDGYTLTDTDTVINALTYRDLVDLADMATALGKHADATEYRKTAANLRAAINARLWDSTKGAYRDGLTATNEPINHYAVHATAFALAFGVVTSSEKTRAARYVASRGMACSVYCAAFLLPGLYAAGAGDAANALLTSTTKRSWMNMIRAGAGSTMEVWDASEKSNTTYSHSWAASPVYDVTSGLFGIQPTSPGYATFAIAPQPGTVKYAAVTQPTVRGVIGVAYRQHSDGTIVIAAQIPSTATASIAVPSKAGRGTRVWVDGVATTAKRDGSTLVVRGLSSGCHTVSTSASQSGANDTSLLKTCTSPYHAAG